MGQHWEYHVHSDETTRVYRTKKAAMQSVSDLLSLGKVVTVSQLRVYYRAK